MVKTKSKGLVAVVCIGIVLAVAWIKSSPSHQEAFANLLAF